MKLGISLSMTQPIPRLGSVDPLAPFTWAARLQTHIPGSIVPLGLYKDTACTIPATAADDEVAAWRDEISGSLYKLTQATSSKRPLLKFDAITGVPLLFFDGVDDSLKGTSLGLTTFGATIQINLLSSASPDRMIFGDTNDSSWSAGWGIVRRPAPNIEGWVNNYGNGNNTGTIPDPVGQALITLTVEETAFGVYYGGVLQGPGTCSVPTYSGCELLLGDDTTGEASKGLVSAVMVYLDPADRALVESYIQEL